MKDVWMSILRQSFCCLLKECTFVWCECWSHPSLDINNKHQILTRESNMQFKFYYALVLIKPQICQLSHRDICSILDIFNTRSSVFLWTDHETLVLHQIKPGKCLLILFWDMFHRRHPLINTRRLRINNEILVLHKTVGLAITVDVSAWCQLLLYQKTQCLPKECMRSLNPLCMRRSWRDVDSTRDTGSHYNMAMPVIVQETQSFWKHIGLVTASPYDRFPSKW